jgi:hypothetical protein
MKDFISKILYFILAIIILICLFIGLSAFFPGIAQPFKNIAADVAAKKAAEAAAMEQENAQVAAADVSTEEASTEDSEQEAQSSVNPPGSETAHTYNFDLTYQDYLSQWDDSTVSTQYIDNPDYQDMVEAFVNSTGDSDDSYPANSSHMITPQPEIVNIEDAAKAQEIMDSVSIGEDGEGLEFDPLFYPYYHMLNDRGQALYRQLYANAQALNTKFAPVVPDTTDVEMSSAFNCLLDDHPELFWVDISFYFQYDYQGHVIEFDFEFYKDFRDISLARETFESTARNLITGAENLGSDYEKELYIHDLLVDKLTYKINPLDQSAYSAVVDSKTVCAGYTKGFQYLMQLLGIPTYNCYGWGGDERHAWNIIKLDDGFHNVDCTWDDAMSSHEYVNLSDSENKNHVRMEFAVYLPPYISSKHKPVTLQPDAVQSGQSDSYYNQ